MHIKRLGWLALGVAGALALGGCGGGGNDSGGGEVSKDTSKASGTVTWWDTSDATNEAPKFKELVTKFQSSHPNIKVNYVNVPFSEAQEKFRTAAQGNSGAPDVLRSEVAWTPDFASLGYLADVSDVFDTKDYLETPLSSNQLEGKLYGVPQVTDAPALLYNKAMLQKAGVEVPKTWADIKAAGSKIKSASPGATAALFIQSGGYFSLPYVYSEGGNLLDAGAKKITINSPEAVKGVQTAVDLVKSGAAVTDTTSDSYSNMMKAFKDGKVAMIVNGPWSIADIKTGAAFKDATNIGISPTPSGSSGKSGSPVGGHNYVIYGQSKVKDAAAEFIKFMNSAESQAFLAKSLGLLPTLKSAYDQPDVQSNPEVSAFKNVLDKATPRPWIPEGGGLFAALDQEYPKALSGKESAQQALDNVAKQWKSDVVTDYSIG